MDGVNVVVLGSQADQGLDMFVASQALSPINFGDLVKILVDSEPDQRTLNLYLASTLATAIIRLASNERITAL